MSLLGALTSVGWIARAWAATTNLIRGWRADKKLLDARDTGKLQERAARNAESLEDIEDEIVAREVRRLGRNPLSRRILLRRWFRDGPSAKGDAPDDQ